MQNRLSLFIGFYTHHNDFCLSPNPLLWMGFVERGPWAADSDHLKILQPWCHLWWPYMHFLLHTEPVQLQNYAGNRRVTSTFVLMPTAAFAAALFLSSWSLQQQDPCATEFCAHFAQWRTVYTLYVVCVRECCDGDETSQWKGQNSTHRHAKTLWPILTKTGICVIN